MEIIKVGRGQKNDIVVEDKLVSSQHLALSKNEIGEIFIQDLNSTNGTFINGNKIGAEPQRLKYNDIIKIGETVLPWRNYFKTKEEIRELEKEKLVDEMIIENKNIEKPETREVFSYERLFWLLLICFFVILLILSIIWYNRYMVKPQL